MGLEHALIEWRRIVGDAAVVCDAARLKAAGTATFATVQSVHGVICPQSREQVQSCVRIASEEQIPLYPVSCGKNWGLGSRVPVRDGCVVLDLGRMNRILDFDERLAWIRVEPGVTFRQAHEYLRERDSMLMLSPTGGPADGSLIGNTVERGDGIGPCGDRLSHICNLEIVLPNGELLQTGFGRFADAKAANVTRTTIGPHLDGLFTQSNLGIVTAMTMWLMRRPKYFQLFSLQLENTLQIAPILDSVRELMQEGVLQTNCFSLWNSYKVLAARGRYPWTVMDGKTPLSLRELKGTEPWIGTGAVYSASPQLGRAARKVIRARLDPSTDRVVFGSSESATERLGFLGWPSDDNVRSVYWRKRDSPSDDVNPDRDRCGVVWLCPVLPLEGKTVASVVRELEELVHSHGFEPNIGLNCIEGRSVHMFLALTYDRDTPGEDRRAMDCHDAALQQLVGAGHYPYRLGIHSMQAVPESFADCADIAGALRRSNDAGGVLAPGRYERPG